VKHLHLGDLVSGFVANPGRERIERRSVLWGLLNRGCFVKLGEHWRVDQQVRVFKFAQAFHDCLRL